MKEPGLLSTEELGSILMRAQNVAKWVKKLETYAKDELLKGSQIPGWKLVEGRSNRVIDDVDSCFDALEKSGVPGELLYRTVPVALTELEKTLSPEQRKTLAPFVKKPQGAPTLVPESDNRKPYAVLSAEEAFGGNNSLQGGNQNE